MEELQELKRRLREERPVDWPEMPDIALYMDQVISYLPRQHIHFDEGDVLTSAMVNNYIKEGLLPRADGKRYSRTHLAYLTAISALKQVLSVRDIGTLVRAGEEGKAPEELYAVFRQELDRALSATGDQIPEGLSQEDLPRLALSLAVRSYADRLACQRIISLIHAHLPDQKRKK